MPGIAAGHYLYIKTTPAVCIGLPASDGVREELASFLYSGDVQKKIWLPDNCYNVGCSCSVYFESVY